MPLFDALPDPSLFSGILEKVLGKEADGSGIAGVLKMLKDAGVENLAVTFVSQLDGSVSADISFDTSNITGGVLSQFTQAMKTLPSDPKALVTPLNDTFDQLKKLSSDALSGDISGTVDGLKQIQQLVPADTAQLFSGAAGGLSQLKGAFIAGPWGELKEWSSSVKVLYDEIEPLFQGGTGTIEDRLLAYLKEKLTALVKLLLPEAEKTAAGFAVKLGEAVSLPQITGIQTLVTDLAAKLDLARIEFENGNFSNTAHFSAAESLFASLASGISAIINKISPLLDLDIGSPQGLVNNLSKQLDDIGKIEIVDLGNVKEKFTKAFESVEKAMDGVNLDIVKTTVQDTFAKIDGVIGKFDISSLTQKLDGLKTQLQSVIDGLDGVLLGVVASIRNVFTQIKDALRSIASSLGTYDQDGKFQFNIVNDITQFLNSIKTMLNQTLKPKLDQFKTTVSQTLGQVKTLLGSLQAEIESVKKQLFDALKGISDQLKQLDVAATLKGISDKFDKMLGELGEIDFEPVVAPVVKQIEDMRDQIKKIDFASMNVTIKGAFKVSVKVVVSLDFTGQITGFLMGEFDKILELPKTGLKTIEVKIEDALKQLNALEPGIILKPLDTVFQPVTKQLDALKLDVILKPLDKWHEGIKEKVDAISPSKLLEPVIKLFDDLKKSFDSVSPGALVKVLEDAVGQLKSTIKGIDITSVAGELGSVLDGVKKLMDDISPAKLLTPLVDAFDKVTGALSSFSPAQLLKPFTDIFDKILSPLDKLNPAHVKIIGEAFGAVKGIIDALDPSKSLNTVKTKYDEVSGLLQKIDIGAIIAKLNGPYASLKAAYELKGPGDSSLSLRVEALNPLRSASISKAATDLQALQNKLKNAFSGSDPVAQLQEKYNTAKTKLEAIVPDWIKEDMTPASIKAAFKLNNPLDITKDVEKLYNAFTAKLQALNPKIIQESVEKTFEKIKNTFNAFDPKQIVAGVQEVIDSLTKKLDIIDLNIIKKELDAAADEVKNVINGLDPRPVIQALDSLTGEVTGALDQIKPSEILKELTAPFDDARKIVAEFDPKALKEPLQDIFSEIQKIVSEIDLGVILKPLNDRLKKLRDELEDGLKRTETAFKGMVNALPF